MKFPKLLHFKHEGKDVWYVITDDEEAETRVRAGQTVYALRGTKILTRAERDAKHGVMPIGKAVCDECPKLAVTRYYANHNTKHESVAHTVCKHHDDLLHEDNKRRRKELGLV